MILAFSLGHLGILVGVLAFLGAMAWSVGDDSRPFR